jgi:predicted dehydrogenase
MRKTMARTAGAVGQNHGFVRVAFVGLGGAAERILLPALARLPDVRVVAGCDIGASARERAEGRWKIPRVYGDAAAMLHAERADIVVVATPPLNHSEPCLLALDHGCHVFCEKPFMPSLEEADRVIAVALRAGRLVAVNNQYYQMPIYQAVKQLLEGGTPGRLYHIQAWQHMYQLPSTEGGWKAALQPRRVLYEFGTHALDLICQFFGEYPEAVSARIPRALPTVDADVFVSMRLDFPLERVATIVLNRISHAPQKYLEMRLDCEDACVHASLGGVAHLELGWNSARRRPGLKFGLATGGEAYWQRGGRVRTLSRQSYRAFHGAAAAHFSRFVAATRTGEEPPVSAVHAREVLKIVLAAYESASRGGELVRLTSVVPDHGLPVSGQPRPQ